MLLLAAVIKKPSYATVLRSPTVYHANDACCLYVVLAPGQLIVYRLLCNSKTVFFKKFLSGLTIAFARSGCQKT